MRMTTILRYVAWGCLGIANGYAGVNLFTWSGVAVWSMLLMIALVDGADAISQRKEGYCKGAHDGALFAVRVLVRAGWRKT